MGFPGDWKDSSLKTISTTTLEDMGPVFQLKV